MSHFRDTIGATANPLTSLDIARARRQSRGMFAAAAPALFVLTWSTGFVVARAMVPHAAPELILAARMLLTAALLGGLALGAREKWPRGRQLGLHLLAGVLLNGLYLCTSWWAVQRGMPAGIMSLLGSLQPLVVAVGSFLFLHERLHARSWAGLAIGLAGVALVLAPLLERGAGGTAVPAFVVFAAALAVIGMAAGTMIQRGSLSRDPVRVAGAVQNAGGAVVSVALTLLIGDFRWDGAAPLWLGLGWSVLILSGASLSLLMWMTRHQGATRVSVLLLLVPPLAAIEAWALFGEKLVAIQFVGFALALGGVMLARSKATPPPEPA